MTAPIAATRASARLRNMAGGPLLVVLVTAVVGFLLVSQLRGTERFRQRLEAEDEADLTRILASLSTEADALRAEVSSLREQLLTLQTSTERDETATQAAEQQLRTLQVLAGTVPVTGPGVRIVIADPDHTVTYDIFIDIVQELRDAGAEAVGVNNRRVGVGSAFEQREDQVLLDGEVLRPPYEVRAIGQPETLEGGLEIPGGAIDVLSSLRGVEVRVERRPDLPIPALREAPSFDVARPVGSDS